MNGTIRKTYSITGLKRWSITSKTIPDPSQIKSIHVYDFDNTLFSSPLPNQQLWHGPTIGFLQTQDCFAGGGWWHDPNILMATGQGADTEESVAWQGWWNENIVQLVQLSVQQKDVVTVLLTGRGEAAFADIINRMVTAKSLEFDLICLKPEVGPNNQRFPTTAGFKHAFFDDLIHTYKQADEIRVYEDRPKHVKGFRDYFARFNADATLQPPPLRRTINAEVIQVTEIANSLDPVIEAAEVQRMINAHNIAVKNRTTRGLPQGILGIKRSVFYTGYLISSRDASRLVSLANLPQAALDSGDIKILSNNVLITSRPAPHNILEKVGGMGKKVTWQVTGLANLENRIWAARVAPIPETERTYTDGPIPLVVLATRKGARAHDANRITSWQPVPMDKAHVFESIVGEKVVLRVEQIYPGDVEYDAMFPSRNNKRPAPIDDENYPPFPMQDGDRARDRGRDMRYDHYPSQQLANQARRFEDRRGSFRGGNNSRGGRGSGNPLGSGPNRPAQYRDRNDNASGSGRGGGNAGRSGDRRGGGGGGRDRRRGGGPQGYRSLDDTGDMRGSGLDGTTDALNY